MHGMDRLIDGLRHGDPQAMGVLIFAVVGTVIIVVISEIVQRRRRREK